MNNEDIIMHLKTIREELLMDYEQHLMDEEYYDDTQWFLNKLKAITYAIEKVAEDE